MTIEGDARTLLDSVIPHEVQHMITASYFRKPMNRWADEGISTNTESQLEKNKYASMLVQFLKSGRGIAFNNLLQMMDYPPDVMPMYAEGFSLTNYLLKKGECMEKCSGKKTFFKLLADVKANGDWTTALKNYYGFKSIGDAQDQWNNWVKAGSPALC